MSTIVRKLGKKKLGNSAKKLVKSVRNLGKSARTKGLRRVSLDTRKLGNSEGSWDSKPQFYNSKIEYVYMEDKIDGK